jgi:subfamily B ATP-binding cassette protein MsbA
MSDSPGSRRIGVWLWRGYVRQRWPLIATAFALMAIEGASMGLIAWMVQPMFDDVFIAADKGAALWVGFVVFAAFMARAAAGFGQRVLMAHIGQRMVADMQRDLVAHILALDSAWFQINPPGTLIERVRGDTAVLAKIWAIVLTAAGRDVVALIALLAVAISRDWMLSLIAIAGAPLLVLPMAFLQRWVRAVSRRAREAAARVATRLDEVFHGVTTIKLNTTEARDTARFATELRAYRRAEVRSQAGQAAIPAIIDIAAAIGFLGVLSYGGIQIVEGRLSVGAFMSFFTAIALVFEPLRRLGQVSGQWQAALASLDRLYGVFAERPAVVSPARPRKVAEVARPPEVTFEDVHFAYGGLPAIDGLSFAARGGEVTALVGPSGAGKSTVFHLLARLADPQRGRIALGGVPVDALALSDLRALFSVVSQETALFDDSLRDNILFGRPDATDAELAAAVRAAHLEPVLAALPAGLDSPAGPRGSNLSGGQRQRVTIAHGEVAEWSKAHAWKVCRRETVSRVRIPVSPPLALAKAFSRSGCGRIFPLFSRVMR